MLQVHVSPQQGAPVSTAIFPTDAIPTSGKTDAAFVWVVGLCVRCVQCVYRAVAFKACADGVRMNVVANVRGTAASLFTLHLRGRAAASLPLSMLPIAPGFSARSGETLYTTYGLILRLLSCRNVLNVRPADLEPLPAVGLSRHRD